MVTQQSWTQSQRNFGLVYRGPWGPQKDAFSTVPGCYKSWISMMHGQSLVGHKKKILCCWLWWFSIWVWVKIRYLNNWMVNTKLDISICGPLGLPFWPTSIFIAKNQGSAGTHPVGGVLAHLLNNTSTIHHTVTIVMRPNYQVYH